MTDLPELSDTPVAEIKHRNGQESTVYQRPDGTTYTEIDILPRWNNQLIDMDDHGNLVDLSKPKPPRSARGLFQHIPHALEPQLKLWAHYQREHDNLQALTQKWIKEYQ